jgi:hypothetical protein
MKLNELLTDTNFQFLLNETVIDVLDSLRNTNINSTQLEFVCGLYLYTKEHEGIPATNAGVRSGSAQYIKMLLTGTDQQTIDELTQFIKRRPDKIKQLVHSCYKRGMLSHEKVSLMISSATSFFHRRLQYI